MTAILLHSVRLRLDLPDFVGMRNVFAEGSAGFIR